MDFDKHQDNGMPSFHHSYFLEDFSLITKGQTGNLVTLLVYIDDIVLNGDSMEEIDAIK